MRVIVIGAGIGGLTSALSLQERGIDVDIIEQARDLAELGVGLNLLPHATRELDALGLLPALDAAGVRTRELVYANRFGQVLWREPRGSAAGYDSPQLSVHRGRLQRVLAQAVVERLGRSRLHTGCVCVAVEERAGQAVARIERRADGARLDVEADALVACDGIHSTVRRLLYPAEGPPIWSGVMLWRGALEWPRFADGRTMIVAGGMTSKLVCYPIADDGAQPDRPLTNWGVMARVAERGSQPPRREDWNRAGDRAEALAFVQDRFRLADVDPAAMIRAMPAIFEYPNCDRDPLPRWSFGRVTLLGDAAHPMYPVGSNGASQAILDARSLARHLASASDVAGALAAYDDERRPLTADIVRRNREGGPERVIDLVEAHAPDGFEDIEQVMPAAERRAIVHGYARLAGYATDRVNRR